MIRNKTKTLIKGFALVAFLPLFAACSSEDDAIVQGGEPQEVRVSIDTRATTDGDTWTWENNDVIGLNVTGYNGTSIMHRQEAGHDQRLSLLRYPALSRHGIRVKQVHPRPHSPFP